MIMLASSSLERLELAFLLLDVFLIQILDFLQVHFKTTGFDTCVHIILQMATSSDFSDSCCCKKILHMEDIYPNSFYHSKHKLLSCPLESDLPSQSDHRFEGDMRN
jgi:hypothetical protein